MPARRWTRENIIEAIRLWASEHGQPPGARDWNQGKQGPRFPATMSVYRSGGSLSQPFSSWAEAIEAAGFPKPRIGVRHYNPEDVVATDLEILAALVDLTDERRYPPTVRELGKRLGFASTSSMHYRLLRLRRGGHVDWELGQVRTLRVLSDVWVTMRRNARTGVTL
jgi:repressor LexA